MCVSLLALLPAADARELTELGGEWQYCFGEAPPTRVLLPHSWNAVDAAEGAQGRRDDAKSVNSTFYKRGEATYTRTLCLSPEPGKRYFLRCGGASIVSAALVNGKLAGRHEGAFTAFCYEITPLLRDGENTISLKVDNSHRDHIAPQRGDFSMFGGLYRMPELIETGASCIDPLFHASPGVFVTTRSLTDSEARVEVRTLLSTNLPEGDAVELRANVKDAEGRVVAFATEHASLAAGAARSEAVVQLTIPNPIRWNGTENPYLYSVHVALMKGGELVDESTQPLGLREVSIDPKRGFILNGKAMQLRGISRHQDIHGKGWALSPADEEQDIRLIADMGATALRTAHYPQSSHIYTLCDKRGLIVWSEVPNVNLVRGSEAFRENNRQQALEMIYQHWNHPSICMWGIYNEIYHQPEPAMKESDMEGELAELRDFVKLADPSRMVVAASNQPAKRKLNSIPEHIAFNTYPGWYGGGPEVMAKNLEGFIRDNPSKGVAVSEYGHGASPRMHENPLTRPTPTAFWHPEEWQTHALEINYACIRERREIWGAFIWNMFDFGSSARYEGGSPGINDKGLVSYDRKTCKDAYFFYKANWNPEPMVYISSRRFAERSRREVPVKVYSNAESVNLLVNGMSVGTVKTDEQKRALWPSVVLQEGENTITATCTVGGQTYSDSCTWTLHEAQGKGPERYLSPEVKKYK